MKPKVQIDTVEEFRRALRVARVELMHAGAKFGALANLRGHKDHARYIEASEEHEEAARQFVYREQLLVEALREQLSGERKLVSINGGRSSGRR